MTQQGWPTWDEIEAEARSYGRLDEAEVARHRDRMRAEQRAYRLPEIRKTQGLTQAALAEQMHVSQRRVSAVEHGDLDRTDLGVVASYVEALGGRVKVVAEFPDREVRSTRGRRSLRPTNSLIPAVGMPSRGLLPDRPVISLCSLRMAKA